MYGCYEGTIWVISDRIVWGYTKGAITIIEWCSVQWKDQVTVLRADVSSTHLVGKP